MGRIWMWMGGWVDGWMDGVDDGARGESQSERAQSIRHSAGHSVGTGLSCSVLVVPVQASAAPGRDNSGWASGGRPDWEDSADSADRGKVPPGTALPGQPTVTKPWALRGASLGSLGGAHHSVMPPGTAATRPARYLSVPEHAGP